MRKIIVTIVFIFLMVLATSPAYCVSASSIDVNDFESTMAVGSTQTITAVVYPNDADNSVSYSSSNTSVATISPGGKIEAKAKGTTTITVSAGAVKKTLTLTVKVHTSKITVNSTYITLKKGEKFNIKARVSPTGAPQKINYTSSNASVAKVNSKGQVKAVSNGETSIFVSNGDISESITVIVNSSSSGSDAISFDSDKTEAEGIKGGVLKKNQVILKAENSGLIDENALKALKEAGRTLVVKGSSYELSLEGKDIVNCSNELDANLNLYETDKGIEFELNNGKPLPGEVKIKFIDSDAKTLKYVYFNSKKADDKEYFGELKNSGLKTSIEGHYYITGEKEKKITIGIIAVIISASVLCILIALYIIFRRRYWFW